MKQPKQRTPKHEAIITIVKEYERSTYKEISLMTGWSVNTIRAWVKRMKREGANLGDKRKNKFNWAKIIRDKSFQIKRKKEVVVPTIN